MKKIILLLLLLLLTFVSTGQSFDKKYKEEHYISYFSTKYREPVVVAYKTYHGGGDCDRRGDVFKGDTSTASAKDYCGTKDTITGMAKYDIGHMMPSILEAYDCKYQKATFKFYNAVPQLPSLNRGSWKHYETVILNLSQKDSLLVICFNVFSDKKLNNSKCYIPDYCIKIVKSLSKNEIIYVLVFSNMKKINVPLVTTYKDLNLQYKFTIIDLILKTNKIDVEKIEQKTHK